MHSPTDFGFLTKRIEKIGATEPLVQNRRDARPVDSWFACRDRSATRERAAGRALCAWMGIGGGTTPRVVLYSMDHKESWSTP